MFQSIHMLLKVVNSSDTTQSDWGMLTVQTHVYIVNSLDTIFLYPDAYCQHTKVCTLHIHSIFSDIEIQDLDRIIRVCGTIDKQ